MEHEKSLGCLICRYPLVVLPKAELMECAVCGKKVYDNKRCINGHYICSECWKTPGYAVVKSICMSSKSKDPHMLARMMMNSPAIIMHGADHHVIVSCALLTAYKNSGAEFDLEKAIDEAISRGSKIPYGVCVNAGTSGAAMSAGIFYSIISGTTPMSISEWAQGNCLVSHCLSKVGKVGGPRCCKRCTFTALETAAQFAEEKLGVKMEIPETIKCDYIDKNPDCIKERCPYYSKEKVEEKKNTHL